MSELSIRPEYDSSQSRRLHEPAIEAIDDLLTFAKGVTRVSYDGEQRAVRREAVIYGADDLDDDANTILFSDLTEISVHRAPVTVEVHVSSEEYTFGPLKHLARVSLRECVAFSEAPFIVTYQLETYTGGGTQSTIAATDVIQGSGLDERVMVPYDFRHLLKVIDRGAQFYSQPVLVYDREER